MSALAVASDYTQLALHVLAHLPLSGPGRLLDPAYLAWSERALPESRLLREDAPLIAALFDQAPDDALHALPELHRDIAELRATASLTLDALERSHVAAPGLLAALRATPVLGELARTALLLAAPAFARVYREALIERCESGMRALAVHLDEARALLPALADARVELAWPLGAHGRAFSTRILVGVPGDFAGLPATTPAVLAMHEAAVRAHDVDLPGSERYVRAEWAALIDVAGRMTGASPQLREAHARWLAALALEPLIDGARALGLVSEARAARIVADPAARASSLATVRRQ